SLLEQTKVQAASSQESKVLVTQKTYVVIDSEVNKVFNKENIGLEKDDDALFTPVGNMCADTTKQTEHVPYNLNNTTQLHLK
ncbi:927_t:CDS:1, partial [Cetraspora pellucida]